MRLLSINPKILSGRYAMCLGATAALLILTIAVCCCLVDGRPNRLADMALGALLVIIKDTFAAYFGRRREDGDGTAVEK